jgi:hypothetical protein
MNHRTVVPSLLFILLVASVVTAEQRPDSSNKCLATILHLPTLTPNDWRELFSEAESSNAEAQYWLGRIYDAGRLLPKDTEKSVHWYQKAAEQGYAPAEFVVCMNRANHDEMEVDRCMLHAAENGVSTFSFGSALHLNSIFGSESRISRRRSNGSNEPRKAATPTLKSNWGTTIRTVMASSKTMLSQPNGIARPPSMFQT